jgi:hypothetical protein
MKDGRGLYYYPYPQNRRVKTYVRRFGSDIEFRLYNEDDPKLWEEHGWVPHGAILQAAALFARKDFDPVRVYDIEVARALLKDER